MQWKLRRKWRTVSKVGKIYPGRKRSNLLSLAMYLIFILALGCIISVKGSAGWFQAKEKIQLHAGFVKMERSDSSTPHEVVIAVPQNNIEYLQEMAIARSTPGNPLYQKWMTFEEVGSLTSNVRAFNEVTSWLEANNVTISWSSRRREYIKAISTIGKWEEMLHTTFYRHADTRSGSGTHHHHRCHSYSIPAHLKDHIAHIFNTVQAPPVMTAKYQPNGVREDRSQVLGYGLRRSFLRTFSGDSLTGDFLTGDMNTFASPTGDITVSAINDIYNIPSNLGSSQLNQSVFQTLNEFYSPNDLEIFQRYYGLTIQDAISIGNHTTTNCSLSSVSCLEGNLDIQYIMGVAQRTTSLFWWVSSSGGDPFLSWITTVADEPYPPKVNSISWGSIEQVIDRFTTINIE